MNVNSYSDHFIQFHQSFCSVLKSLPPENKIWEVAKRISIVAMAAFVYVTWAFVALFNAIVGSEKAESEKASFPRREPQRPPTSPAPSTPAPSTPNVRTAPPPPARRVAPLTIERIKNVVKPSTAKYPEIRDLKLFPKWTKSQYKMNLRSPTKQAYDKLIETHSLQSSLHVGVRGDGNCSYRAFLVSLLLQVATDGECSTKIPAIVKNMQDLVESYRDAIPGYKQDWNELINLMKRNQSSPEQFIKLLNDDDFVMEMATLLRFISNAIALRDFDRLPQEIQTQIQFNEGVTDTYPYQQFLQDHAVFNVATEGNIPGHMFGGVLHLQLLADKLQVGYWIGAIENGNPNPLEPITYAPQNPLLTVNLICKDNRHFDALVK